MVKLRLGTDELSTDEIGTDLHCILRIQYLHYILCIHHLQFILCIHHLHCIINYAAYNFIFDLNTLYKTSRSVLIYA